MKPSPKSPELTAIFDTMCGRTAAITNNRCIPPPIGCGGAVDPNEFRDAVSRKEYTISGLCQKCQDAIWGDE